MERKTVAILNLVPGQPRADLEAFCAGRNFALGTDVPINLAGDPARKFIKRMRQLKDLILFAPGIEASSRRRMLVFVRMMVEMSQATDTDQAMRVLKKYDYADKVKFQAGE